jgi:hypothetical protein
LSRTNRWNTTWRFGALGEPVKREGGAFGTEINIDGLDSMGWIRLDVQENVEMEDFASSLEPGCYGKS